MGQYLPISTPAGTGAGAVIDPEMIDREMQRVARAHNAHSPTDFSPSCIASAVLVDPNNYFLMPFGIKGSWDLGAVTYSNVLASMAAPITGMVLCGGYVSAEYLAAPAVFKLYVNGVEKEAAYVAGTPGAAVALSTLTSTPVSLTGDQIIDIRASGTISARNVIFFLKVCSGHTS